MSNKQDRPSSFPAKRPLDNSNSLHASVKKSKVSDLAASIKTKLVSLKHELKEEDDDDDISISQRIKKSAMSGDKSSATKKVLKKVTKVNKSGSKPFKKQIEKTVKKSSSGSEYSRSTKFLAMGRKNGLLWFTMIHIFPPPYQPHGVKMLYKGRPVDLTPELEEVATKYAAMRDTEYMPKDRFKENFWNDWQKLLGRNHVIQNLIDCDFTSIYDRYQSEKEKKKQMTTEDIGLLLINFVANPKEDDDQPFIPSTPPTPPRPVDHEDLRVGVDALQEQLQALQDELRS